MMLNHINSVCPYCSQIVTFAWTKPSEQGGGFSNYLSEFFKNSRGIWIIGECPSCKNCVLIRGYEMNRNLVVQEIFPFPLPTPVDGRVPEKIRTDLEEAKLCFSVGAINASVGMCRKALQRACKDKGASKKDLYEQIDEIAISGVISTDLKELAHSVRLIGNEGVHPNEDEVTPEDASEILNLAEQFLDIIFVAPARVKEIRERKDKNKLPSQPA